MKMKKAIAMTMCAVMLVAASVMGTMAFLTGTDKVENTFTVGKLSMTLDEARTDAYGVAPDMNDRVHGNEYKMIPGHHYVKDPTVHMAPNSEASYVFVKVDNGMKDILNTKHLTGKPDENGMAPVQYVGLSEQMRGHGWEPMYVEQNGEAVAVYVKKVPAIGAEGQDLVVFDYFDIASNTTNAQIEAHKDAKIVVTAYAVQQDGFASAEEAWNATFKTVK